MEKSLIKKVKNEIYRENNREKINKQKSDKEKQWRIDNPELAKEKDAEKRKKRAEAIKIEKMKYRIKNKEKIQQYDKEYRERIKTNN